MTGFNMPPGVSTNDIPGNNDPELSEEAEEVLNLLESAEGRCPPQHYCDRICEVVERIVAERELLRSRLSRLQEDLAAALDYSNLHKYE